MSQYDEVCDDVSKKKRKAYDKLKSIPTHFFVYDWQLWFIYISMSFIAF